LVGRQPGIFGLHGFGSGWFSGYIAGMAFSGVGKIFSIAAPFLHL